MKIVTIIITLIITTLYAPLQETYAEEWIDLLHERFTHKLMYNKTEDTPPTQNIFVYILIHVCTC